MSMMTMMMMLTSDKKVTILSSTLKKCRHYWPLWCRSWERSSCRSGSTCRWCRTRRRLTELVAVARRLLLTWRSASKADRTAIQIIYKWRKMLSSFLIIAHYKYSYLLTYLLISFTASHENNNSSHLVALYPGQSEWAGTRTLRNINKRSK